MKELNREAQIMMRNLKKLTQAIEELEVKTHRLVTSKTRGEKDVKIVKEKQTKKTASNKIVPMKPTKPTAFDTVIRIIRMSSEGVSVDQIKEETGFDAKKISNILYKAKKRGLVKSLKQVVYKKIGKTNYKNHRQDQDKQERKIEPKATEKKSIKKSSPPTGSQVTIDYPDASEWTKCSMCGVELKKINLNKHLKKTHKKKKIMHKVVILKNDLPSMLTKPRPSKTTTFEKHPRSSILKRGCPGCGAVTGCYCK